jgi:hypothetical protein
MTLCAALRERRDAVLGRWIGMIRAEDGRATANLPARGTDPFHDPVGAALRRGTAAMLDSLLGDLEPEAAREAIDGIVRVRCVQELTPSRALGFVFLLRRLLRDVAGDAGDAGEWSSLDARLDAISLQAFEVYVDCREKVSDIKVREAAAANAVLLRRARLAVAREAAPPIPAGETPGARP